MTIWNVKLIQPFMKLSFTNHPQGRDLFYEGGIIIKFYTAVKGIN